jgi:hypothetical protein
MIIYFVILLITLFFFLFKKQYEYNNVKCLVVICGGARTFYHCIDSQYQHVISKLCDDVSILFYLKSKDPGPKGQEGWNFQYDDIESESINKKINELKETNEYKNKNVFSHVVNGNEIEDNELLKLVKDRSKYNNFLDDDNKLTRCLHQLYNFKRCGELINSQNINYDYYIFLRPDLFFTESCFPIEQYSTNKVTLQPNPVDGYYTDHVAIIPRVQYNNFFFGRMKFVETNETITCGNSEQIFWNTIDHEDKKIGDYYIKR